MDDGEDTTGADLPEGELILHACEFGVVLLTGTREPADEPRAERGDDSGYEPYNDPPHGTEGPAS